MQPNGRIATAMSITAMMLMAATATAQNDLPKSVDGPPDSVLFGDAVESGADVNLDQHDDIVVKDSAWINSRGENVGRLYLYSGKTGEMLWSLDGTLSQPLGRESKPVFIDDFDGDQRPDVLVGYPAYQGDLSEKIGMLEIRSGFDGSLLWQLPGGENTVEFGRNVVNLGDVDGDLIADFASVVRYTDADGLVGVYSGTDASLLYEIPHSLPRRLGAVPDIDGDNRPEIVIGRYPNRYAEDAKVTVYSGAAGSAIFDLVPEQLHAGFGYQVTGVPDITGDDIPDVLVSGLVIENGFAWAFSGADGSQVARIREVVEPHEGYGIYLDAADVFGDSRPEIIVGSWRYLYVFSTQNSSKAIRFQQIARKYSPGWGNALTVGDINGDGWADIIAGGNLEQKVRISSGTDLALIIRSADGIRIALPRDERADFVVNGAQAQNRVHFIYSLKGVGATVIPNLNLTIDLVSPKMIGSAVADAAGRAIYSLTVPSNAPRGPVWFQAVELSHVILGHVKSQVLQIAIQ